MNIHIKIRENLSIVAKSVSILMILIQVPSAEVYQQGGTMDSTKFSVDEIFPNRYEIVKILSHGNWRNLVCP